MLDFTAHNVYFFLSTYNIPLTPCDYFTILMWWSSIFLCVSFFLQEEIMLNQLKDFCQKTGDYSDMLIFLFWMLVYSISSLLLGFFYFLFLGSLLAFFLSLDMFCALWALSLW